MKPNTILTLIAAAFLGMLEAPTSAASPCDYHSNEGYCYIWLPAAGLDALTKAMVAAMSRAPTVDVVVVRVVDERTVFAKTPYGYAYGVFSGGRGNLVFENGIRCFGIHDTSVQVGYNVDYGYCMP